MARLGLALNKVKTSIRRAREERFDFLGHFFGLPREALAKVIFVILSEAKDLDSSVAYGSLRMTDM